MLYFVSLKQGIDKMPSCLCLLEGGLVTKRHVDQAMVSESAHASYSSRFLTTSLGGCGNEHASVFAPVRSILPLAASCIPI